jgi:hypothetical protein
VVAAGLSPPQAANKPITTEKTITTEKAFEAVDGVTLPLSSQQAAPNTSINA